MMENSKAPGSTELSRLSVDELEYFKLEWVVDPLKPKLPEMTMSPLFCARKG